MRLLSAKAPCCTTFFVACIQLAVSGNCPVCCSSWQLPYSFRRPRVSQPHLLLSAQHFVISHSHIFLSGISYSVDTLQTPIPQKMFNNNRQTRVNQHLLDAQQFPIPFLLFAPQSRFDSPPRENHSFQPAFPNSWVLPYILWETLAYCANRLRLTMEGGRST